VNGWLENRVMREDYGAVIEHVSYRREEKRYTAIPDGMNSAVSWKRWLLPEMKPRIHQRSVCSAIWVQNEWHKPNRSHFEFLSLTRRRLRTSRILSVESPCLCSFTFSSNYSSKWNESTYALAHPSSVFSRTILRTFVTYWNWFNISTHTVTYFVSILRSETMQSFRHHG